MFLVLESSTVGMAKVSTVTRCLAKGVDIAVIFLTAIIIPYPLGILLGLVYTLAHDGMFGGQSLGKRLFQLRVNHVQSGAACTYKESAVRNAPLGVAVFFGIIPFWGWIILVLLGLPLVALEIYLMMTMKAGSRLGDVMADTHVVESPRIR